jgi:lipopolysaccharide/colanic/teichoic acid biosynthesis glycosyltransferase
MHDICKRTVDLALATAALTATWPLLLLVALLIRLDSPGPALFRQRRLGLHGRPFVCFKFRTMHIEADDRPHREAIHRAANGVKTERSNGQHAFKPPEDPRVTRAGRVLRAWGLDELPQLINVLRDEMSLVGPRPAIEYELAHYKDWYHRRFAVRPGITGPWQVRRRDARDFDDMMRMDVEYASTPSIWEDLKLMAMTIPTIVRERGVF